MQQLIERLHQSSHGLLTFLEDSVGIVLHPIHLVANEVGLGIDPIVPVFAVQAAADAWPLLAL